MLLQLLEFSKLLRRDVDDNDQSVNLEVIDLNNKNENINISKLIFFKVFSKDTVSKLI